jgi:hypothetical protein
MKFTVSEFYSLRQRLEAIISHAQASLSELSRFAKTWRTDANTQPANEVRKLAQHTKELQAIATQLFEEPPPPVQLGRSTAITPVERN